MQKYKYTALNIEKKKFNGTFYAENENHLRQQLAQQNLYLVSCKPVSDASPNQFFSVTGKIEIAELTNFCRQFSIMLNSGISILDSLAQLKDQNFTAFMRKILYMVYDDVKIGVLLSKAMEKHKKVFPEFFRSMIYVGEVSGNLEQVLNSLADYYDNEIALKRKISSALAYPIMMGILLIAVVLLFLLFIIPKFQETLGQMDVPPEGITKIVFDMSDWVFANGLTLVYVIVLIGAAVFLFFKTQKGKYCWDYIKYHLIFTRSIQINMVASKFTKATGLLLSSGMNLVDALDIVQNLLGNLYAQKVFKQVIEDVRRGASLTFAMKSYNIFPQMMIQMVSTGEKTGEVDKVLVRSSTFFDQQVEQSLIKATSTIQPIMLGTLAIVIGGLFIAIYSPMLSIMNTDYVNQGAAATDKLLSTVCSVIGEVLR